MDPNLVKYKNFTRFIDDSYKVFEKHPEIDEFLDMILGYVEPNFRCSGIGFKLIEENINLIRKQNISVIKNTCTSLFSANIMESMKFEKVFEIPFKNYVSKNYELFGNEILDNIKEPHDIARVYLKKI